MENFNITIDRSTAEFYGKIAQNVGLPTEKVLEDALFKLAGELSLAAIYNREREI